MVNVLLVEDSIITRELFERQLAASRDYCVISAIENAANAEIACMRNKVDLVLMDVCTADDESGLKAAEKIKRNYPHVRVVIMTSMPEHSFLEKAQACGCDGFWYKENGETSFLEMCDRVMGGEPVWPDAPPMVSVGLARSDEFTERELAVVRALTVGKRYEDIAGELGISLNTVKYHVKNVLQKTGFHNTVQLVAEVVEKRLILPRY